MIPCPICGQTRPDKALTRRQLDDYRLTQLLALEQRLRRDRGQAAPQARHWNKLHNRARARLLRTESVLLSRSRGLKKAV